MKSAYWLRVAAGVCALGLVQGIALGQGAAPAQLTDTPVAPPNTAAMVAAGVARDNAREFGSSPDDPGPLAKDLSPRMTKTAVGAAMRKVADWQLGQTQQYFTVVDRAKNLDGRIWTWSVLYTGFMAADSLGDAKYRDAMVTVGKSYDWKLRTEKNPSADDQSLGQMYLENYLIDKKPEQMTPTQTVLDGMLAGPRVQLGGSQRIAWWWCDALFMGPPVWARMYAATGDRKYIGYLDEEFAKTSTLLYDPEEHLYARDATYIGKKEKNGQKMFWSRGEGWVMGGLARTLEYLPKDDPARAKYVTQLQEMAAVVAKLQGKDGLWRAGLLDAGDYELPEMSGSALMTFGMAWGVNNGVLDKKVYGSVIQKAWAGMLTHIYADGRLGCIQQTGAEPAPFKASSSYNYGVGGFLLAGSEIYKMAGKR